MSFTPFWLCWIAMCVDFRVSVAECLIGTLLKAQIEIQGLPAGNGVQQRLERWWRRGMRPRPPAALEDPPGIKPALHLSQRAGPGWRIGRQPRGASGRGR